MKLDSTEQILVNLVRTVLLAKYVPQGTAAIDVSALDWQSVADKARQHRLDALLYESIKMQGWRSQVPSGVLQSLAFACTRINVTNLLVYRNIASFTEDFLRADIPFILLKGCALAESLYQNIGLRPMGDIDVLVPMDAVSRVSSLLTQLGYESSLEPAEGFRESFEHEHGFVSSNPALIPVDVHWHLIHVRYYYERIPAGWFWERTIETRLGNHPARILALESQFVHLMMHYFFAHESQGLLWSHDMALLLARYRESFDWDQVLQAAQAFRLSYVLKTVLKELETIWNIQIADQVHQRLTKLHPGMSERIFATVYSAKHTDAQTFFDIWSVSGMRTRVLYLWRTLFPASEYMQTRYRISKRLVPFYYFVRLSKGLFMFLRSIVSMGARLARFPRV